MFHHSFSKLILCSLLLLAYAAADVSAQEKDSTDLMATLEKQATAEDSIQYTRATFNTTRLINGHSVENVGRGVLDVKISHRFGTLNSGWYELFGLDNATMRMGLDYGISPNLMVGFGRSTFKKTYDAFLKIKLLRQSTGKKKMPITLSYIPTMALQTEGAKNSPKEYHAASHLYYTHQLLIARKFSSHTSFQLMPTFIHRNLSAKDQPNDILAIGIGGRQKPSKRISLNVEYYYQLPGHKVDTTTNSLSIGIDIETGGHVFQLHFTNSAAMNEHAFISETTGKWGDGDILFGFNISRVFNIGKNASGKK